MLRSQMLRRLVEWTGLFGGSGSRTDRLGKKRPRSEPRSLRVESLEQRALLSVSGLGSEAFKTIAFTASGKTTSVYKAGGYNFNMSGTANLTGGAVAYSSVSDSAISTTAITVSNGTYFANGKSPNFSGTWNMRGNTDGVVEQLIGSQYGRLTGNAVITSSSMQIPTKPTQTGAFNGTYDLTNAVFNTQNFGLVMDLTQPTGAKIHFAGTLTPTAPLPFDVIVTPTWNADGTAINVGVQVPGKPHTTRTADRSVPVTNVQLYWANGTSFANKMGGALTDKIPVYWNEASGQYQVTNLPSAPVGATNLLFVSQYDGKIKVAALALPTVSIGAASVAEGDSSDPASYNQVAFPVTLSRQFDGDVTVSYQTFKGPRDTAKPGVDYLARSGSITILAGQTQGTISVPVIGNTKYELNKTFSIKLTQTQNAGLSKTQRQAVGTITNDDPLPGISIVSAASVAEPTVGVAKAHFVVTLSNPSYQPVQVRYATADGTAKAGEDYVRTTGVLTFAPGQLTKSFDISIKPDKTQADGVENFVVNLYGAKNASILVSQGTAAITKGTALAGASRNAAIAQFAGRAELASYFQRPDSKSSDKDLADSILAAQ